jgi:hypothetical protein
VYAIVVRDDLDAWTMRPAVDDPPADGRCF